MTDTVGGGKTSSEHDLGQTLLERFMGEALLMVVEAAQEKERIRANLHSIATRALFTATEEISNLALMDILKPGTPKAEVAERQARFLRSAGGARGLTLPILQAHATKLLLSGLVSQAKIARAWANMLIFDAARKAFHEARKVDGPFSVADLQANPELANRLLNQCFKLTSDGIADGFQSTTTKAQGTMGVSLDTEIVRRFLHYSASAIVQAMDRPVSVSAAFKDLDLIVYPEIDAYVLDAQQQ